MQVNVVFDNIGKLLVIVGAAMVLPVLTALLYGETTLWIFIGVMTVTIGSGAWMAYKCHSPFEDNKAKKLRMQARDGYLIVTLGWLIASLYGMLPYLLAGTFTNVADALFESVSGFATVGASVLDDIEGAPYSILMWRSTTHWLGGMGIIVLFVAILSGMGSSAMQIFKAETTGPVKEKLQPKVSDSARMLWYIYLFNTGVTIVLFLLVGMDLFDAINHAFSVVATGGFSTKNASVGGFESGLIDWAVILSMYLAGINYTLFFYFLRVKKIQCFTNSRELRVYTAVVLLATALICFHVYPAYGGEWERMIREVLFHVLSIITTTGFVISDYELWVAPAKYILILLAFCGACSGSTTCGFKIDRHIILWQQAKHEIQRFIHPRMVTVLKANGQVIGEGVIHHVSALFYAYLLFVAVGTILAICMDVPLLEAFTGVVCLFGGVGPALGAWGPVESFSSAPALLKYVFVFLMLSGRLEIFAVLSIIPSWHQNRNDSTRIVEQESME